LTGFILFVIPDMTLKELLLPTACDIALAQMCQREGTLMPQAWHCCAKPMTLEFS